MAASHGAIFRAIKKVVTLLVVRRNEQEFADFVSTERGFLTLFGAYNEDRLKLEGYQIAFLESRSRYRCSEKSRQTGYSFIFAGEATARCHLREKQTSIFVSYNLDDAKEKIAYARQIYEELPIEYQKKLVGDSKTELAFQSLTGARRVSRILSNPSKAPRGKTGDIYLDELAHYRNDREVYKGSTALILRSSGQLTVCSSPLGRRGLFWEIARQEVRPYSGYWRQRVPWWLCGFFCNDVKRAAREAPKLETEDRVRRFALKSGGIMDQFGAMAIEDFQEEFEVIYQDDTQSFFPFALINACVDHDLELVEDPSELAKCRGRLNAGFDVGRKRDVSELVIIEEEGSKQTVRYMKTFEKVAFQEQEEELRCILQLCPIARLSIDATGMGSNLAENLQIEYPNTVVPENFGSGTKSMWVNDFKIGLQRKAIVLPAHRPLVRQIHAIRKRLTPQGNAVYEVESGGNKKEIGHGDKFWALALATQKDRSGPVFQRPTINVRVFG